MTLKRLNHSTPPHSHTADWALYENKNRSSNYDNLIRQGDIDAQEQRDTLKDNLEYGP
jgi:hypothetical protein